ncbi:hypothetical protein [Rhodobacter sp. 24-YEA-8]|uniref:hypothetical protein n=1 Tax=Rhodobacter sp. 24-YEA-8 TaxID=1884310 RepID=UPI00089BDE6B|nr:hypothetical protein [Rhodobacter sp. 24-YEA-8]SEC36855.1 hypothetical protein SAMN05519105_2447 [Rhodobacter sp. 24-YEA-8]
MTANRGQTGAQDQAMTREQAGAGAAPAPVILWQARPDMRIYALIAVIGSVMGFYPVLRLATALAGTGEPLPPVEIAFALIAAAIFVFAVFMLVVILAGGLVIEYRLEQGTFFVERRLFGRLRRRAYSVSGIRFFRIRRFSCLVQAGKPDPDGSWPASSTITLFSAAQRDSLRRALPEGTFP